MKKLVSILLTFLFLASGVASARGKEIAAPARDKSPGALISGQAGLPPFFSFMMARENS